MIRKAREGDTSGASGGNEEDFHAGIEFVGLSEADLRKIAKMHEWFTSDEYRNRRATQGRE